MTSIQPPPPPNCLILLSNSPGEGGVLQRVPPAGDPFSGPPLVLLSFSPSEMEQQPVIDCGRLFKVACSLFILMLIASLFWTGALHGKSQKSGAELLIFWRWEDREFRKAMRVQVGTTFSSTNSSNKMGSFESVYQDQYYDPVYSRKEVKIQTMPAYKQH